MLFRFYMGYVFPSVNCIDEGVERWLLPRRLCGYTDVPVVDIRYFTFLPEFLPAAVVRLLSPIERRARAFVLARLLGALHGGLEKTGMNRHSPRLARAALTVVVALLAVAAALSG